MSDAVSMKLIVIYPRPKDVQALEIARSALLPMPWDISSVANIRWLTSG